MSTRTCPEGHQTSAEDWCDVCGAPMDPAAPPAGASPPPPTGSDPTPAPPAPAATSTPAAGAPAATTRACASCDSLAPADALFCEVCGYDFTTGELPPEPAPAAANPLSIEITPTPPPTPAGPAAFVAEVWVDPDWYAAQESDDPCPSAGTPVVVPLHERSLLVGRTSASRGIHPQIDCASDTGVSRRHAQLSTDGQRWWVEDLQSANGTFVGSAGAELPTAPVAAGQRQELADDDRLYLGAWTRIVVRAATADEQGS